MAVTNTNLIAASQSGTATKAKANWEFTTVYQVTTDDPADGPYIVLHAAGLPLLGSIYTSGNDPPATRAKLDQLSAARMTGTRTEWRVTATWKPSEEEEEVVTEVIKDIDINDI